MPKTITNWTIVLDLDSTLIHTFDNISEYNNLKLYSNINNLALREQAYRIKLGTNNELGGLRRPYLKEFLVFCSLFFENICVYSAGLKNYVDAISEIIFYNLDIVPKIIYSRSECLNPDDPNNIKKPLSKIYSNISCTPETTLMLDDRADVMSLNFENGIIIPRFEGDNNDFALIQLMSWLSQNHIYNQKDVRLLDKSKIFIQNICSYSPYIDMHISDLLKSKLMICTTQ